MRQASSQFKLRSIKICVSCNPGALNQRELEDSQHPGRAGGGLRAWRTAWLAFQGILSGPGPKFIVSSLLGSKTHRVLRLVAQSDSWRTPWTGIASVHGMLQASILERVARPSSRASSRPRDRTHGSCVGSCILYRFMTYPIQG